MDAPESHAGPPRKSPRVAVLTLHYGGNHGAILQAETVARHFGGHVVDHRYRAKVAAYRHDYDRRPFLLRYVDERLPTGPFRRLADDFSNRPTWEHIDRNYDLLVCGSDELWKFRYRPRAVRSAVRSLLARPVATVRHYADAQTAAYYTPFPNVYWPDVRVPRVAFAASIGESDAGPVPARHRAAMARCLAGFRLLGVRDGRTRAFVLGLDPDLDGRTEVVPDPVFSYRPPPDVVDAAREQLARLGAPAGRFGFVHMANAGRRAAAMEQVKAAGFEPVDLYAAPLTPPEWFAAIGLGRCGVTDAMHPFIAAVAQNVPCLSVDPRAKSAELRDAFGVAGHADLRDCLGRWPGHIPDRAADYRGRVERFVQKVRAVAERPAG